MPVTPPQLAAWAADTIRTCALSTPHATLAGALIRRSHIAADATDASCGDDLHCARIGPWLVVALADGAASPNSVAASRAACHAAVASLSASLARLVDGEGARRSARDRVAAALHAAMSAARLAVEHASDPRAGRADSACGLLLSVHAADEDTGLTRVWACQIGGGITACVDINGQIARLSSADADPDATLTSIPDADWLRALGRHTAVYAGRLRTLLTMTRGVAGHYAPADPHVRRLEADLVLNDILPSPVVPSSAIPAGLASVGVVSLSALSSLIADAMASPEGSDVQPRSAVSLASALGLDWRDVAREPLLLALGHRDTDAAVPRDHRLRDWLMTVGPRETAHLTLAAVSRQTP